MAEIHPSAEISPETELAEDVIIGRRCVITGKVRIGRGTRLIGDVYIDGPAEIGEENLVYPFSCLGFAPQYRNLPLDNPSAGIKIGNRNILRESVTIHRATGEEHPTILGDDNYMMVFSHVGHDSIVGNNNTFANNAALGGHCIIEDLCTFGGQSALHQFCRMGHLAMLGGGAVCSSDIPPFTIVTDRSLAGGPNLVGARRAGFTRDQISDVRWAYRIMFHQHNSIPRIREMLTERADQGSEPARTILDFLDKSTRGLPLRKRKGPDR